MIGHTVKIFLFQLDKSITSIKIFPHKFSYHRENSSYNDVLCLKKAINIIDPVINFRMVVFRDARDIKVYKLNMES